MMPQPVDASRCSYQVDRLCGHSIPSKTASDCTTLSISPQSAPANTMVVAAHTEGPRRHRTVHGAYCDVDSVTEKPSPDFSNWIEISKQKLKVKMDTTYSIPHSVRCAVFAMTQSTYTLNLRPSEGTRDEIDGDQNEPHSLHRQTSTDRP